MDTRFDDLLHTIIVEKGQGIYGFFDIVMGFMYRRTDFYYEMAPGENMGFFPGQAEAIIYNFFRKYQNLHFKERVPKRNIDPKEIEEFMKTQKGKGPKSPNLQGIPAENVQSATESNLKTLNIQDNKSAENQESEKIDIIDNKSSSVPLQNIEQNTSSNTNANKSSNQPSKKIDEKFESISTYNGDKCDKYSWSQGVMDVNIQVKLPDNTQSSKVIYN